MPRATAALGVELWVKRDDLTGSHLSGNKIRKLEYLLAAAQAEGATAVVTCGGIQSNHCRATALAAAQLGLTPHVLLRTPRGTLADIPANTGGNVLLDRLAGAHIHACTPAEYVGERQARMLEIAQGIAAGGGRATIIPEGGSNALGALGYADAAAEILAQLPAPPTAVVSAIGSGGTLAGLAMGFAMAGVDTRSVGVCVCDDAPTFEAIVATITEEAAQRYDIPQPTAGRVELIEGFQGDGYAISTARELAFLRDVVRRDGLVLDPVYTGKAFLGLCTLLEADPTRFGDRVVFVHTGGIFGLFPKADELAAVL